jgi:hypothetical protein
MSGPFGSGEGTGDAGYTGGEGGANPSWQEILDAVPQEYHEKVTPVLQKWDQGVQQRFETVQSEIKPWKNIIQNGYDPESTQFALNLVHQLNEDPKMVYEAIGKHYNLSPQEVKQALGSGQGQGEPQGQEDDINARYQAELEGLKEQQRLVAQLILNERQEKVQAAEDQKLADELDGLRQKYGNYNEQFVLSQMQYSNKSAEDAVKAYFQWREQELGPHMPKPLLMAGGGSLPSQNVDPRKLNDKQTKDHVIGILAAAAAAKNQ